MNARYIFVGIAILITGVWIYIAQSLLGAEETPKGKRLIIKEGNERTEDEVAAALAKETGFDLEGAYTTGYTTGDIIDFLTKEPHKYDISSYKGKYYEGRITISRTYPLAASFMLIIAGIAILIFKGKNKS